MIDDQDYRTRLDKAFGRIERKRNVLIAPLGTRAVRLVEREHVVGAKHVAHTMVRPPRLTGPRISRETGDVRERDGSRRGACDCPQPAASELARRVDAVQIELHDGLLPLKLDWRHRASD